jgi:hypothetical protein
MVHDGTNVHWALLILTLLLAAPFMGTLSPNDNGAQAQESGPEKGRILEIGTFDQGKEVDYTFFQAGNAKASFTLPKNSVVVSATMDVTSAPHRDGGLDYPLAPKIDILDDGEVEWAFAGENYGRMGYQTRLFDGSEVRDQSLGGNGKMDLDLLMPKGSDIVGANVSFSGYPLPFWGPSTIISDPYTETPVKRTPHLAVYGGKLWAVWSTMDPKISDGGDSDIVVRKYDGDMWGGVEEITMPGDDMDDTSPEVIVYHDEIYVFWFSKWRDMPSFFIPNHILYRKYNGTAWSEIRDISFENRNHHHFELNIFQDQIYAFWIMNTSETEGHMKITYTSFDGVDWATPRFMIEEESWDWSMDIVPFDGRLWVIWDGFRWEYSARSVDVYARSFDGTNWDDIEMLNPNDWIEDWLPRMATYDNPRTGKTELYSIWSRGSAAPDVDNPGGITESQVAIAIMRHDGQEWGPLQYLTSFSDNKTEQYQDLIQYQGRLYAVWIHGLNSTFNNDSATYSIYGNVMIMSFDGTRWSPPMELTPPGGYDNATRALLAVYKDKLFVGWGMPEDSDELPEGEHWEVIIRNIEIMPLSVSLDIGADGEYEWGEDAILGERTVPMDPDVLEASLGKRAPNYDSYYNPMATLPLKLRSTYPSHINMTGIGIEYRYTATVKDFSTALNDHLEATGGYGKGEGNVTFNVKIESGSEGKVILKNLKVVYFRNFAPELLKEVPDVELDEDMALMDALVPEEYFWDDWDDGHLHFTFVFAFSDSPGGVASVFEDGKLGFRTTEPNWHGEGEMEILATDNFGLTTRSNKFMVRVLPVNDPPVLEPIPDRNLVAGDKMKWDCEATDVDGDELTFYDDSDLFNIDPKSGMIEYKAERDGTYPVNITVSDGNGGTDSQVFYITVKGASTSQLESPYSLLAIVIAITLFVIIVLLIHFKFKRDIARLEEGERIPLDEELPPEEGGGRRPRDREAWRAMDGHEDGSEE